MSTKSRRMLEYFTIFTWDIDFAYYVAFDCVTSQNVVQANSIKLLQQYWLIDKHSSSWCCCCPLLALKSFIFLLITTLVSFSCSAKIQNVSKMSAVRSMVILKHLYHWLYMRWTAWEPAKSEARSGAGRVVLTTLMYFQVFVVLLNLVSICKIPDT